MGLFGKIVCISVLAVAAVASGAVAASGQTFHVNKRGKSSSCLGGGSAACQTINEALLLAEKAAAPNTIDVESNESEGAHEGTYKESLELKLGQRQRPHDHGVGTGSPDHRHDKTRGRRGRAVRVDHRREPAHLQPDRNTRSADRHRIDRDARKRRSRKLLDDGSQRPRSPGRRIARLQRRHHLDRKRIERLRGPRRRNPGELERRDDIHRRPEPFRSGRRLQPEVDPLDRGLEDLHRPDQRRRRRRDRRPAGLVGHAPERRRQTGSEQRAGGRPRKLARNGQRPGD